MGFPESWQLDAWFWEEGGIKLARELYAKFGLFFVGPIMYGSEPMHLRVPVHSAADFRGLKFRTPAGMTADLMTALGSSVVILPGGEIYTAMDTGVIDGAEWGVLNMNYDLGVHEVAKYFIHPGFHQPTGATEFAVRMEVWKALPPDLQATVEAAAREWSTRQWYVTDIANISAKESMIARGNVLLELPEAEVAKIREIAKGIWDKWAARSPMAARIIESQIEFKRLLGILE
jgi:TRAP-type mannitol/chloroaromatic compound transport system substrate-binding protein